MLGVKTGAGRQNRSRGVKTESRVSDLEQVPEQGISNYSIRT